MTISTITTEQMQAIYDVAVRSEHAEKQLDGDGDGCFDLLCEMEATGGAAATVRKLIDMVRARDVELLAVREAQSVPIGCIKTISGNKTLQWWRDAPEGSEVFTVPPEPAYPEKLPCAVHLLPGLKLGEGVATKTLLEALARREEHNVDMAAMTVEQLAVQEDAFNVIKAMLPAPAVTDERTAFENFVAQEFGELVDQRRAKNGDNEYMAWDMAMGWIVWQGRSAMIQPVSQGYTLPDGYKLMPIDMTDEIGEAIAMEANCCGGIALDIYNAAMAAAPTPTK